MNIKPKLRGDTAYELVKAIEKVVNGVDGKGLAKSCLNCRLFDEATEICGKFNMRPPARVIAYSCEHYEDCDDIPF